MCLVEVKPGPPKPQASCALRAAPETHGDLHRHADGQEAPAGVMEFLLINHPLDCPICDQGGECDLQDRPWLWPRRQRYADNKRAVEETVHGAVGSRRVMTRCIQCTRCVRFITEVAGAGIGLISRGEDVESPTISTRRESELSAKHIDLCPVVRADVRSPTPSTAVPGSGRRPRAST